MFQATKENFFKVFGSEYSLTIMDGRNTAPNFSIEAELRGLICGVDEAGRGPLAGPVVAAAVILNQERTPGGIQDSKTLSRSKREHLCVRIKSQAVVGIGLASVAEIDKVNILRATFRAMERAVAELKPAPAVALVDGNQSPALGCATRTVVGGDRRSLSIAAASIVAKVTRDQLMLNLARGYPGYGWERNVGYPTPEHLRALTSLGVTPHHRTGFVPVARVLGQINKY